MYQNKFNNQPKTLIFFKTKFIKTCFYLSKHVFILNNSSFKWLKQTWLGSTKSEVFESLTIPLDVFVVVAAFVFTDILFFKILKIILIN